MLSIASIYSLRRRRALDIYRATGHRHARLYPIFFGEREGGSRSLDDLARRAFADDQQDVDDQTTVLAFRRQLELAYCDSVGVEASALEHLCVADDADTAARRAFLFEHAEQRALHNVVIDDEHIARVLHAADTFDKWMQRDDRAFRKQYSCEGVTGFLAAVWAAMAAGASDGARHIVMSLTHRSRAQTMLALGVPPDELMRKFLGGGEFDVGAWPEACGDLLYNLPARGQVVFADGSAVRVDVPPNPCHLELGRTGLSWPRARSPGTAR
jgi:2-oxoglutarate dehydrogenase complex dehydrogenase (E1) component-like enzyme